MRQPVILLDLHFPEMLQMPDLKDITMPHLPVLTEDSTDTSTIILMLSRPLLSQQTARVLRFPLILGYSRLLRSM